MTIYIFEFNEPMRDRKTLCKLFIRLDTIFETRFVPINSNEVQPKNKTNETVKDFQYILTYSNVSI